MTNERDPTLTRQGFIKAQHLTPEQVEAITALLEEDMAAGTACRQHGTSLTQYIRRVRKDPAIWGRLQHRWAEWRRQGVVPSDDGGETATGAEDTTGVRALDAPD